jgi:hypothetical protein
MIYKGKIAGLIATLIVILALGCSKEEIPGEVIANNNAPYYGGISTVLVQNYVNRLYIDLIGREPLDSEMVAEVQFLRETNLSFASRDSIITKLQNNEDFLEGDSSYKAAYFNRLYELFKVKMLEGASNADVMRERNMIYGNLVRDSIAGDYQRLALSWEKINKLDAVIDIEKEYMHGKIEIKDAFARLLNNVVYDKINMNTFNFLRASFNDLFDRFPTQFEFDNGFVVVEDDQPGQIFGEYATNKFEYIEILVNSKEFYEGIIRWTFGTLLARAPTTFEVNDGMKTFYFDHKLPELQKTILITDEYANFK